MLTFWKTENPPGVSRTGLLLTGIVVYQVRTAPR